MAKKKKTKKRQSKKSSSPITDSETLFPNYFWKKNQWAAILVFLLPFAFYLQTLDFEYVLDDQIVYTENSYVKKGFGGVKDIFTTESFQGYFGEQKDLVEGGRYRPLSIASFAVEYALFGQKESVSHFINILLYALTGLLLLRVLFLFFPKKEHPEAQGWWTHWFFSIPLIATLLFVLHPIHTEVVANVKGRDEIMCLLGSLAAVYFAFRYVTTDKVVWAVASGIALLMGLFGKENAITFVGIIPLSLYFFTYSHWKKILLATLPALLAFILWFGIRWQVLGFAFTSGREVTDLMNNPFAGMASTEKYATIFYTLGLYVKLLFFPHPLTHDYYPYHIPIMRWTDWQVVLSLLLYIALGLWSLWGVFRKNVFAYAILFYLFTLSITSNLPFTVGTFMNERFVYISSIGFCIGMAYFLIKKLPTRSALPWLKYVAAALTGLYLIGFGIKTFTRIPAWKNPLALNSAAIKVSKNSARANTFMGTALFKEYQKETDQARKEELINQVAYYIDRSLSIHPYYGSALTMKSGVVAEQYKFHRDIDQLLDGFYKVLTLKSNVPYIDQYMEYLNGGRAPVDKLINWYYKTGTMMIDERGQKDIAIKFFKMGLDIAPDNPQLRAALQRVQEM